MSFALLHTFLCLTVAIAHPDGFFERLRRDFDLSITKRRALNNDCTCINPEYLCQIEGKCWGHANKESCESSKGSWCTPKPCTLKNCKKCSFDGKECRTCEDGHMAMAIDSCTSFTELLSDVSASSFSLSGNLVLLSSKKIAGALADGMAGVPKKSRTGATALAIAAFAHHFKDQFDAVAVYPSTKVASGDTVPGPRTSAGVRIRILGAPNT